MACLPLRGGALGMRQSICEIFEGNEGLFSDCVNVWLLSLVHNMTKRFTNIISISYCSGRFSFSEDV